MQKKKKKKKKKIKFLKFWKRPLFDISEYAFKYLHDLHKGLRSEVPPQRIWNSHIILHSWMNVLVKFQIGIRFFTELLGNSKLSMT